MAQGRCSAVLVVSLLLVSSAAVVHGVDHNVGGTTKWIKPDGSTVPENFYQKWASEEKFTAGDNLVFVYNPAGHSVLEVSATDYAACSTTTPIKRYATGNDIISVPAGPSYWICGIPSHCPAGQKFNITAAAGSSGPSSSVGTGNAVSILHVVAALAVALIASMSM
ncbi:mavicyanin [Physcomitrium patens]|uniref:Phytocyanin domain-containing protein n=1 Tax=Physcomitrium patens TaxID=3218 RepID=A0A2K1KVZ2_PHYPA|nr:mavicyanin-like [Physcomitrium patens]PNR57938.1 hypothetical protein PHYPA_004932 [Physcomitrium patens]|eukprot:XP_024369839.1 mavicyanin-like [Physcomitrella patens]